MKKFSELNLSQESQTIDSLIKSSGYLVDIFALMETFVENNTPKLRLVKKQIKYPNFLIKFSLSAKQLLQRTLKKSQMQHVDQYVELEELTRDDVPIKLKVREERENNYRTLYKFQVVQSEK